MLSLADDLDHFDGLEPVQLFAPLAAAPTPLAAALRRRVTTHEAVAGHGAVLESDLKWHLSTRELDAPPDVGATIRDAGGDHWTVLRVDGRRESGSWQCWCRNLAISAALGDRITIQQAIWLASPSGAPVAHWIDVRTDLPARIQPLDAAIEVRHARRTARVTHHIFVAEQIVVDDQHRVVHDQTIYHVLGYESAERLDKTLTLRAERTPWPLGTT